jgi:hypothetical protein
MAKRFTFASYSSRRPRLRWNRKPSPPRTRKLRLPPADATTHVFYQELCQLLKPWPHSFFATMRCGITRSARSFQNPLTQSAQQDDGERNADRHSTPPLLFRPNPVRDSRICVRRSEERDSNAQSVVIGTRKFLLSFRRDLCGRGVRNSK